MGIWTTVLSKMKLRTIDLLESYLDSELSWRKQETTTINMSIKTSKLKAKDANVRAGVVLLYSHWEGFIKNSSQAYLNHICCKGIPYTNLKNNFRAIGIKEDCKSLSSKSLDYQLFIVDSVRSPKGKFKVNPESIIDRGPNLKSEVLKEIISTIGFDYGPYELKKNLIDERLVKNRNKIAHGHKNYDSEDLRDSFSEIKEEIFEMLEIFKSQVIVAANNQDYLE